MSVKVVITLNLSRYYLCLFSIAILFSLFLRFLLPFQVILKLFFYAFIIHLIFACYIIYSFFEFYIMKEKQGSKLTLSKDKIFF